MKESVCPTWDQTLIIKQLLFFGDPKNILESPPPVVIEFFNKNTIVSSLTAACDIPLSQLYASCNIM